MRYETYKPSGIEWIGEIPSHWEVKKLKYIGECKLGKMLTNDDKGGYFLKPYLRAQNIRWFSVDVAEVKEMWFSQNELQKLKLKENDLLVSEGGEVGRTCIWRSELEECYIQNSVHLVRFEGSNSKYYMYHFFYSGQRGYFDAIVNKISIGHLTVEKLRDLDFIYPPPSEQIAIANFLDEKNTQFDNLIERNETLFGISDRKSGLLNEYRTKYIGDVITGKIKVI